MEIIQNIIHKFLESVAIPIDSDGCWLWTGGRTRKNYGYWPRKIVGEMQAHRAAYRIFVDSIPADMQVLHECDNPPCVNPYHLKIGTNKDNVADRVSRGRSNRPIGERNGSAKLTAVEVEEIRNSKASSRKLGRKYGVGKSSILRIRHNETWIN
jgi:hypothetical protein